MILFCFKKLDPPRNTPGGNEYYPRYTTGGKVGPPKFCDGQEQRTSLIRSYLGRWKSQSSPQWIRSIFSAIWGLGSSQPVPGTGSNGEYIRDSELETVGITGWAETLGPAVMWGSVLVKREYFRDTVFWLVGASSLIMKSAFKIN